MNTSQAKIQYLLHLGDNALIMGQRLGEWCGHGPVLEQDMAMTNISLDYIGRARLLFQYVAELQQPTVTEDDVAFMRSEWEYRNLLLTEQDNGDFAHTVVRQFFLEAFQFPYFSALAKSSDARIAAIAEKTVKETAYHLKWSSEWLIRLGDGTEESHQRVQRAVDILGPYTGEMFAESSYEQAMVHEGVAPNLQMIRDSWQHKIQSVFEEATLPPLEVKWMQKGGKDGRHSEHLGYILADLQYMQRAYPGLEW